MPYNKNGQRESTSNGADFKREGSDSLDRFFFFQPPGRDKRTFLFFNNFPISRTSC